MQNRALALVCQERVSDSVTKGAIGFSLLGASVVSVREVRGFELVILRCGSIELVDRWRLVVHGRRIDANNATVAVNLVSDSGQQALDFVWRETVKLLQDPEITRKRLRQRLWVIILKAGSASPR